MEAATLVLKRTCPACRARYQVRVVAVEAVRGIGYVHQLDWLALGASQ